MFIIYKVKSLSNKYYIGICKNFNKRITNHISTAKTKRRAGKFQKAILKYKNSLVWKILDKVDNIEKAFELEKYYIKKYDSYNNGYNMTKGGQATEGFFPSKKTREKMRLARLGKKPWNYKKKLSREHKDKLSAAKNGYVPWNTNIKYSKEVRNNIAKKRDGRYFTVYKNDEIVAVYCNQALCAEELNIDQSKISLCLCKKRNYHKGYIFKFVDQEKILC